MKWYTRIGRRCGLQIRNFLSETGARRKDCPTLAEFWGRPLDKVDRDFQCGSEIEAGQRGS
jgi:hypothetical protein